MGNGDLRAFLEKNELSLALQILWFCQMARTLEQIHDKRVLVADIATRNFLLDSDLSVNCAISPKHLFSHWTQESADYNSFSIQTDIGQLGAVMCGVVTGSKCDFGLFKITPPVMVEQIGPNERPFPTQTFCGSA
jgi:serine/threonine protein kinase